ncbi:MAG: hypothetical protein MUE96_07240 [Bacteroidia bacterium]|jgi:hypothetical protein|nr:hypothetical protein [Bacteroidia bacterium]
MRNVSSTAIVSTAGKIAFVVIGVWICVWQKPFFYDEYLYLSNVLSFIQLGWATDFLMAYKGSAGPVYAVLQAYLLPITDLTPWMVRLVNWVLLGCSVYLLHQLASKEVKQYWHSPWQLVLFPMVWVVTGMALTEMVSLTLFLVSLVALYTSARQRNIVRQMAWLLVSAVAMGLAIAGRQTYALGLVVMPLLWRHVYGYFTWHLSWWLALAAAPMAYLYGVWGGFTAPYDWQKYQSLQRAFAWQHVVIAFGYIGILEALLSPAILQINQTKWWLLVAAILGFIWAPLAFTPLASWMHTVQVWIDVVVRLVNGLLFASAWMWLFSKAMYLRDNPFSYGTYFYIGWILLAAIACGAITHQFSSRYLLAALPFVGTFMHNHTPQETAPWMRWLPLCLPLLGAISLLGYYVFK